MLQYCIEMGKEGKLPSFKIGNVRYFQPEEILALGSHLVYEKLIF